MIKALSAAAAALAVCLAADASRAQAFDYYVLALTWSPSWCLSDGDPEDPQCARGLGFTLHGLWPQYQRGWPEDCPSEGRDPSRLETAEMADVMGSGGLAWYEWKKHGRCTGLSAEDYFAASRRLYEALRLPAPEGSRASAEAVEATILAANPALFPEALIVTCGAGRIEEVRICLTRDFAPRACAADVERRACRSRGSLDLPPPG